MWLPPHVKEILANALNNCMCAEDCAASLSASVQYEPGSRKLVQSYPKVAKYPLEKFATD